MTAFVIAAPKGDPCGLSLTCSRLSFLSSETRTASWSWSHEAKYGRYPSTGSSGWYPCLHACQAPSSCRRSKTLWNSLFSFSPWVLNVPSTVPHSSSVRRVQRLQYFLRQVKWGSAECRFAINRVIVSPLLPNRVCWTSLHVEVIWSNENILGFEFWFWFWSRSAVWSWACLLASLSFTFLIHKMKVIISP